MDQIQRLPRIPRKILSEHIGKVVIYATKTDVAPATGRHGNYTGVVERVEGDRVTFRYETWVEPSYDYQTLARDTRTISLDEIILLVPSPDDAEGHKEFFLGAIRAYEKRRGTTNQ